MSGQLGELVVSLAADLARFRSDMGKAAQIANETAGNIATSLNGINGQFNSMSSKIALVATKFNMITVAVKTMSAGIQAVMSPAIDAVENYQASVVKTAAMIVSMQGGKGDIADNYRKAKMYAEGVQEALVQMDARSIASARQIQIMNDEFVKGGILIDANNKKQVQGYENIANALAVLSAGMQNPDLQFSQEVRGLLSGEDKATNTLFRQLAAIDLKLKDHLQTWKEQGVIIERVGDLLIGYKAASGDIQSLWTTIKSTLSTMVDQVLRAGMVVAFRDIVQSGIAINDWVKEHRDALGQVINKGWLTMKGIIESIRMILEPFAPILSGIAYGVNLILDGWGMIGAVALPTVVEKLMSMVKVVAYFGEIARGTFAMFTDFIGVLGTGLVSLGKAAMQAMIGDFSGAQKTLASAMSGAYLEALTRNAASTRSTFNALKSEMGGLFDLSGFDRRMADYSRSGVGRSTGGGRPDIKAPSKQSAASSGSVGNFNSVVELWNGLNIRAEQDEFLRAIEENEKKFSDLVTKFKAEGDKSGLAAQGITLESIAQLKEDVESRLVSDSAGKMFDEQQKLAFDQYKSSIELAKKLSQEKKAIAESEAHNAIANIEAMQKFGDISIADAASGMIAQYEQILTAQREFLAGINHTNDPTGWLTQQNAIDRTREKITELKKTLFDSTAMGGMVSAMKDYARSAEDMGSKIKNFTNNVFQGMEDALVKFVRTGKLSFSDLANSIISDMVRIAIQRSITGPLAGAIGSAIGSLFGMANGGAWSNGVQMFANGGVFSGPTMFGMANGGLGVLGEAGDEAVMPLSRTSNGKLGVTAINGINGRQSAPNVIINIENQTGQQIEQKQNGIQFDGENWVVSMIMSNVQKNGPLRGLMAGAGAY